MNFQELLTKIAALESPVMGEELNSKAQSEDVLDVDECGMGPMEPMKQQDNVSMSINMNGSGTGGIRDLLDILRDIESGGGDDASLGDLIGKMGKDEPMGGMEISVDEYANEPDEMYGTMADAVPAGDDIHKPHGAYPATQLGDNPMAVKKIQERLESLYQDVKSR